jgi:hypothetical protein
MAKRNNRRVGVAVGGALVALLPVRAGAVVSSNGGANPPYTGLNLNTFLGADRFYGNGYTGSRCVVANIEAGHVWNGHETLGHVNTFLAAPGLPAPHGDFDRHATFVGGVIGGRPGGVLQGEWQRGIAHGAELWSGSVATAWTGEVYTTSFSFTNVSMRYPYHAALVGGVDGRTADVVNTSFGSRTPRDNSGYHPRRIDGLINQTGKVMVFSAGNEGSTNVPEVGAFASTFNSIAVASLTSDTTAPPYNGRTPASSRGPNDFWNPATQAVVPDVVAAVDLAAPGTNVTLARYGGTTGGNIGGGLDTSVARYAGNGTGTSFAAPMIAGGAGLVIDAGKHLFPDNSRATDGRVVKSVLQNSATKTLGWNNVLVMSGGVRTTQQALDYGVGAGRLNLNRAYDQYTAGTTDLEGLGGGGVDPVGWDFGEVAQGAPVDYLVSTHLLRNTPLNATLNWFIDNRYDYAADTIADESLDNLDLEVWKVTPGDDVPDVLIAQSISVYNNVEHLSFTLPETAEYRLRVNWTGEVFDTVDDANRELFALAWSGTPVPEPSGAFASLLATAAATCRRRRRARRAGKSIR